MGQDQVSGGVSVFCWLAAPVAMFFGNLGIRIEYREPTRDEYILMSDMTEDGININDVALHFDIHKTFAYLIINHFGQTRLAADRQRSVKSTKLNPLEATFIHIISGQYLSHARGCIKINLLSFSKPLYDRHCAPFIWHLATMPARFGIE